MINTSYIFDTLINNLDKSKVDLLSLKVGQIVKGNVVQLFDGNQALVSIKGTTVLAKTEVPLAKGQQSMFLVTAADDDIKLKLLKDGGGSTNNQSTSSAVTKEVLKYLDLKSSTTNKQIVEGFIKENLPLDKATVNTISNLVDEGYELKNLLATSKVLSDKKLPITDINLRVVSQFFNEDGLADKLTKLNANISKNPNINSLPDEVAKLLIKTEELVGRLLSEIKAVNQGNVSDNAKVILNESSKNQNLKNEYSLNSDVSINKNIKLNGNQNINSKITNNINLNNNANLTVNSGEKGTGNSNVSSKDNMNINSNASINSNIKMGTGENDNNVTNIKANYNINSSNVANPGNVVNSNLVDSKNILQKLNSFMEEMQFKPFENIQNESVSLKENLEQLYKYKELLPKELASNLERTVQHLTGQQLINQPDSSPFSQLIFQFPSMVPFSNKPVYLKFQAKKQEGTKALNPNDVNLAFLFQLNNIGDLVIKVKINDNQMFIQFLNNNPTTKEIIKQLEPSFVQFLHEQGYKTSGFTFLPLVEAKQDTFTETASSYKGVDIRL